MCGKGKKKLIIHRNFLNTIPSHKALVKLDCGWLVNETPCVPGAKIVQLFSEFAPLYFVFLRSSDCKCLSFLNSDLHLIYLLSIKETVFHSFHFISFLSQLLSARLFVFEVF